MFEKYAEEYVMREDVITENDRVPFDNGYGFQTVSFEKEVKKAFKDGAEFGYNKANEWHYVKDGDLPKPTTPVLVILESGVPYVSWISSDKGWWFCTNYYTGEDKVIAWKEIVLPTELSKKWVDNYEDYQNASNDITFSQYPVYKGK